MLRFLARDSYVANYGRFITMQQLKSHFYWFHDELEQFLHSWELQIYYDFAPHLDETLHFLRVREVSGWVNEEKSKKSHAAECSSASDNTPHERMFSNSIFRVAHTKRMPSLSRFMFRTAFAWAYKSDITKIFPYSLWYSLGKLSLENELLSRLKQHKLCKVNIQVKAKARHQRIHKYYPV